MSAADLAETSFWQFFAAVEGWRAANNPSQDDLSPPTPEEHDAMIEKYGD